MHSLTMLALIRSAETARNAAHRIIFNKVLRQSTSFFAGILMKANAALVSAIATSKDWKEFLERIVANVDAAQLPRDVM